MERQDRRHILEVPGALAVVGGTGGDPAPVQQSTIDALRAGLNENRLEPHPLITVGQKVRICSGAFSGMEGVVLRKKSGVRVVLAMEFIMQGMAVEVNGEELVPVGS